MANRSPINLATISIKPGVYLMKNQAGEVLYVGKAKNLKKRLTSYFKGSGVRGQGLGSGMSPKTRALVERIHKVDTVAVANEVEALILENELIKKHRPPFNVVMRDDKSYLYIRITVNEEFPRILLARKVAKDGARYFGPYASSGPVYEVLKLIQRTFPLCSSEQRVSGSAGKRVSRRACMNYHLKICPGVCVGKVKSKEYHKTIKQVAQFLHGNYPPVIQGLKKQMAKFSAKKEFERAARIQDGLKALEAINERQNIVKTNPSVSEDAIGVARELNKAMVVLLQVRSGKLINQQQYAIDTKYETELPEILAGFLRDYYSEAADLPKMILLPEMIEESKSFEKWLADLTGKKIGLSVPTRGRQWAIVRLAQSNAEMKFNQISGRWHLEKLVATEGVDGLKKILKLKKLERIEAYDASNLQGTDAVGAMVVWEKGMMDKKQYRRFKIKTVTGPNDFASLAEVLKRRFAYLSSPVIPAEAGIQTENKKQGGLSVPRGGKLKNESFSVLPDVVLIDGGKGQVNTVAKVLKGFRIAVIGIVKGSHSRTKARDDLVTVTGVKILLNNSPTKILLQNIRDEAHRFAIAYHTHLRGKRMTQPKI
ncbi:MAG: excinuclease ABC subunit UvrC [bacterium]